MPIVVAIRERSLHQAVSNFDAVMLSSRQVSSLAGMLRQLKAS